MSTPVEEPTVPAPEMSAYERAAWQALLGEAAKQHHRSHRFDDWTQGITGRAKEAVAGARTVVARVPGADAAIEAVDKTLTKATEGLNSALVERGLNSVKPASVFAFFAEQSVEVNSYGDIRRLDLKHCDRSVPRRKDRYVALLAAEGAASSLAASGSLLSATATGGATSTVAVGAVVADVTTVLAGMGRIVALVAAHYGYDVREQREQIFASGVIAYSSAGSAVEQAGALASLSRLTGEMMHGRDWQRAQPDQLVTVVRTMSNSLGFKMARRKLSQAVPVIGTVVNSGINARIAYKTVDRAQQAYRLRFLTEKYGLDPARWAPDVVDVDAVDGPLVDEVLDAELAPDPDDV